MSCKRAAFTDHGVSGEGVSVPGAGEGSETPWAHGAGVHGGTFHSEADVSSGGKGSQVQEFPEGGTAGVIGSWGVPGDEARGVAVPDVFDDFHSFPGDILGAELHG